MSDQAGKEQPRSYITKGKYVFTDELTEVQNPDMSVPYFTAKAIMITADKDEIFGDTGVVRISDLILKQSTFIDEHGKHTEAHKLYIWPGNLGSTKEWTAGKREFLTEFVLNFPLEVLSVQESNGVTWRYITPENFKKFPEDISASQSFREFAEHRKEYFFLRRPLDTPK
jgi:hypothetical protein